MKKLNIKNKKNLFQTKLIYVSFLIVLVLVICFVKFTNRSQKKIVQPDIIQDNNVVLLNNSLWLYGKKIDLGLNAQASYIETNIKVDDRYLILYPSRFQSIVYDIQTGEKIRESANTRIMDIEDNGTVEFSSTGVFYYYDSNNNVYELDKFRWILDCQQVEVTQDNEFYCLGKVDHRGSIADDYSTILKINPSNQTIETVYELEPSSGLINAFSLRNKNLIIAVTVNSELGKKYEIRYDNQKLGISNSVWFFYDFKSDLYFATAQYENHEFKANTSYKLNLTDGSMQVDLFNNQAVVLYETN